MGRLAYVGLSRGKRRVKIWFVSNLRIHGLWQSTIPSRFLDELPEAHVEVMEANTSYGGYGGYGASRWDGASAFKEAAYTTPGWRRAQAANAGSAATGKGGGDGWSGGRSREINYGEGGTGGARAGRGHNQPPRQGFGLYSSASKGGPREIEGELVAKSVAAEPSRFSEGDRVFHLKFGNGTVANVEGNKLTVDFDKAGQKRVLEGFVEAV